MESAANNLSLVVSQATFCGGKHTMGDFMTSGDLKVVLLAVALSLPIMVIFGTYYWWRIRRDELLINLKRDLVERGMSAQEIQMVIDAGTRSPDETDHLKRDMLDRGMSAEQIDKVLSAGEPRRSEMHV
jgi:hypothetical protein